MPIDFDKYLNQRLKEIQLDESVFGSYITSILEDESTDQEKSEALEDVLAGVAVSNIKSLINEILSNYNGCNVKESQPEAKPPELDVEDRLVKLLETQKLATNEVRTYSEEEKKIRDQILAQYSQLSADEEEEEVPGPSESQEIFKNTNFSDVHQRVKEQRENLKLASDAKKLKDKEDREKQKQLREEKKEKRKTVKGERKR